MSKKLLCFILTLCMLLQAFGMVSFASDEMLTDEIILENDTAIEEEPVIELAAEKFSKEYVNDNFADGKDSWAVGQSQSGYAATVTTADVAGAVDGKALKISFPTAGSGSLNKSGNYGAAVKLFDDAASFSTEETVTVKARVKADSAMNYQIKANRPDSVTQPPNDFAWSHYYSLLMHGTAGELSVLGSSIYATEIGQTKHNYRSGVSIGTNNDTGLWTEYAIVFKPAEKKYYVTVVTTDANGNNTTVLSNQVGHMVGTQYELDTAYGAGYYVPSGGKYFLDLNSLTFTSRTAGNLYVDYVKVYGSRDFVNATASLESNTVSPSGSVTVNFSGSKIPAFPEGAVTIDGVECEINPDVAAQKITFTPKAKLTPGDVHTVRIDDELFLSKEGVVIGGQTEFNVEVQYAQATALLISNTTIEANESVTVKIDSTEKITSVPEGLVTIDGVVCSVALDVDAQTVTLTPVNPFSAGGNYTVTINTELLKTDCGSILNGENSFDFSIAPLSVFGLEIDGKPAPEVTVGVKYDYEGVNGEGSHIYKWQTATIADAAENEWVTLQSGTEETYTFGYDIGHGEYVRVVMTPYDVNGNEGRTIASEPVMFKYVPSEDEDGVAFRKYYINDDYNTAGDVGNWKAGNVEAPAGQVITVAQETLTENGENVGAVKFYGNKADSFTKTQPAMVNEFDKINFKAGSTLVVETRFKVMGGINESSLAEGSYVGLKFNRPNDPKYLPENSDCNYRGWNGGTLLLMENYLNKNSDGTVTEKRRLSSKFATYQDSELLAGDFTGQWINAKIVMDGEEALNQKYAIYILDDDGNVIASKLDASLKEHAQAMYDMESFIDNSIKTKTKHEDIRRFSFVLRNFADTVYVDYFKFYELRPAETATAEMITSTLIRPSDYVTVKFTGSLPVQNFADGVVTIDGVETEMISDVAAQTVTVIPKQKLTPGQSYTVRVNKRVLSNSEGFVLEGTDSFDFNVGTVNVYDVATTGRTVPGTTMGISYRYADSVNDEGTHTYQWQKSTDGVNWVDIPGETNDTYVVTQDIYDNKNSVRIVMTPYDNTGVAGATINAVMVIPETTPVLENVTPNTTILFPDLYLGPKYDYIDPNNDKIVRKDVQWYSSDSESGPWTPHSTDEYYYITENDLGKYFKYEIKVTNDGPLLNESAVYESTVAGPVQKIVETTNLINNGGFERGDILGWNNDDGIIEIAGKEGARTGNYAVHLKPRTSVSENWPQSVTGLTNGKSYILGGWVKKSNPDAVDITNFWPYTWSGLSRVGDDYSYLVQSGWVHAVGAFKATAETASVDFVSFHTMKADAYIDDIYFGELLVADIETFTPDVTEIPAEGTVKLSVTSGRVLNQLGTTHGLLNEKVILKVPEGTKGITQVGNDLVIDNNAVAGTYTVEVYCVPSYNFAAQEIFQKFITVTLVANNDQSPKAREVKASGEVKAGKKLTGSYEFYQIEGKQNNSTVQWMYSDTFDGTYAPIPGATSMEYVVESNYADKFIKFAVNPATTDGLIGTQTLSDAITMPRAPYATNVSISGKGDIGATLTANYTYNDYNAGEAEGQSLYQWYASDYSNDGFLPISGATAETYTLRESDVDKYIKVAVTPVSTVDPAVGTAVMSEVAFTGPKAPTASDVTITKNGLTLVGAYKYNHVHGARETKSVYRWTVNGAVVSDKIDYTINFTGAAYVEFSVTPVGDTNPSTGKTYSYGAYFEGYPAGNGGTVSGGGFGGGGGGGGGAGSTGITNINDMKLPETEVKQPENTQPKSDLDGHWGETYVKEMEKRGVMKADDKGNFDPDRIVSRAEMITYLFDALGLEEAEYNAEFSDVSALDGYAGKLQAMIDNGTIASYHEFRPNDGISRQEMCKILYVSLENAGKLKKAETNNLDVFTDKDLIADWATDYVNTIYVNKIMIGTSDVTFAPTENITRAQVATMLVRILKVIEG